MAPIPPQWEGPFQIMMMGIDSLSPVVFVQNNHILPSQNISSEKNSPISYTLSGILDTMPIMDGDSITHTEIDPYELSISDRIIDITLDKLYKKHTFIPTFDYSTSSEVLFEISSDGKTYFQVTRDAIENFDVWYIRITFRKTNTQNHPTWIRSISFYPNIYFGYLVLSEWTGEIIAYRGSVCDPKLFQIPSFSYTYTLKKESTPIEFSKNPFYKNDADLDGRENIQDNCPYVENSDQKDRNYDGIGDACSDDDYDGIFWIADNCPTVSNFDQVDKNINHLWDACEFDSDGDTINDSIDNAIHEKNPDQKDTDLDNIGDVIDNCFLYNPDQRDEDKNGKGDICDRNDEYRKIHDIDMDTILDFSDNCLKIPNPDQKDWDADGYGDACDNCLLLQNSDQRDVDKNGIGDACDDSDKDTIEWWKDNCPSISNRDQKDSDNDQKGDVCEDTDNDSILDSNDNCPTIYNPDQKDTDRDHIWNSCDHSDDRPLESNHTLFMILFGSIAMVFIGGIVYFFRKIL